MAFEVRRPSSPATWQFPAYEAPALVILLALCYVTILSLTHPSLLTLTHSSILGGAITTASLLVAFAAAYVALAEFLLYGLLSSLYIGLAFLTFFGGDIGMRLIPLLAGWGSRLSWSSFGWGIEDAFAGALLVAAGLLVTRIVSLGKRPRFVGIGLFCVFVVILVVSLSVFGAGRTSLPHPANAVVSLVAAILFYVSSILFWRASKTSKRPWFFWLSLSLALAGFAQFQYAIQQYPITVVQPGDVLRLVFFTGILLALAAEWSQNYRRLRWQARDLGALQALTGAPDMGNLSPVLHHIEKVAANALQAAVRVLLAESEGPFLDDAASQAVRTTQEDSLTGAVEEADQVLREFDSGNGGRIVVGVPLRTSTHRLGVLIAARDSGDDFTNYDVRLLRAFGDQASILLERSLLYEEVAAGAVLQERSRLAREIHDGLAQHLAFLKMRVAWLKRSPGAVNAEQLQDIEGVLETALIEARHAITTLRAEPQSTSTIEAITRYTEEFGQVSGLEVKVDGDQHAQDVRPKARVELLRVVQEALNNVRKHAHATNVEIEMKPTDRGVEVSVRDDGVGFSMDHSFQGHFGLEIMRERAESVGGRLEVDSKPNVGTVVRVWMPSRELEPGEGQREPLGVIEA